MSLHLYTTQGDRQIVVTMGWDRPLQGFFMSITEVAAQLITNTSDEEEGDEIFLFNNLDQKIPYPKEINSYLAELEHQNIGIPEQMASEVVADRMHNVGNKCVDHTIENGHYIRTLMF